MEQLAEFYKEDHRLYRLDSRIKLAAAFAVLVMVLNYHGFFFPCLILFICVAVCLNVKIPLKTFALRFSEPVFIAAMLVAIKVLFSGKQVWFLLNLHGIQVTGHWDGFMEGLAIAGRMAAAVAIISALEFTTPFTEILSGLAWFKVPRTFIEVLMFAYRYLFVLYEEAEVIYSAQRNRLGYSSLERSLNSFGTLAGSLVIKTFEHSQNTTVAMAQRGYDGNLPRLGFKPFRPAEVAVSLLVVIILGFLWRI